MIFCPGWGRAVASARASLAAEFPWMITPGQAYAAGQGDDLAGLLVRRGPAGAPAWEGSARRGLPHAVTRRLPQGRDAEMTIRAGVRRIVPRRASSGGPSGPGLRGPARPGAPCRNARILRSPTRSAPGLRRV